MGGFLVSKLVKPTKIFCSGTSDETGVDRLLVSKAKPDIRAVAARILRESDPAVRQEVGGLDPPNRIFRQLAELATLFVGDCGA
jgi:hypothetical protein